MRILVVTSLGREPTTGLGVRQLQICNALSACGNEVDMLVHAPVQALAEQILEKPGRFFPTRMIRKVTALEDCDLRKFDIILVESPPGDYALVPWLKTRLAGPPVVLDYVDFNETWSPPSRKVLRAYLKMWDRLALRLMSDYTLVISEGMKTAVTSRFGLSPDRVFVVPNGVDTNLFGVDWNRSFVRQFAENGTADGTIPIAYVGNLAAHLSFEVLVRAAESAELDRRVRFVIIGGSSSQLVGYRRSLSRKALERFQFLGRVPQRQIPRILQSCLAGVVYYPTDSNTGQAQTMKLLEYMASGLPVISTKLAGIVDILGDDYELFFEMSRPEQLVQLINRLTANPKMALRIGNRNSQTAQDYSWENMGRLLTRILQSIPA